MQSLDAALTLEAGAFHVDHMLISIPCEQRRYIPLLLIKPWFLSSFTFLPFMIHKLNYLANQLIEMAFRAKNIVHPHESNANFTAKWR